MKIVLKFTIFVLVVVIAIYHISFFVMPSVTVQNESSSDIKLAYITLPNSGLDFGEIKKQQKNTIHYSLQQSDGVYQYRIVKQSGIEQKGQCGYITNNEIHKRVVILITDKDVSCNESN